MATKYFAADDSLDWGWPTAEFDDGFTDARSSARPQPDFRPDPLAAAAVVLIVLLAFYFVRERTEPVSTYSETSKPYLASYATSEQQAPAQRSGSAIIYPYDNFTLTQGPHGTSYGHLAIDLAAGAGAEIKAPITGEVSAIYLDEIGNPTIVIENDQYTVTMLHGDYQVFSGQMVAQGQVIGRENNRGYTTDMLGRLCTGRDCGNHTHLNIFDKRLGANVNPLEVLSR